MDYAQVAEEHETSESEDIKAWTAERDYGKA